MRLDWPYFSQDTLKLPRILGRFPDIRQRPRIPLHTILVSVFLMPFWGLTALLRGPQMLSFFHAPPKKRVVVSDTTITRVLTWLAPQESRKALLALLPTLNRDHLLQRRLVPGGPLSRLCVLDGSQMSARHYLVAALLCGAIDYPVTVEPCPSRGQELKAVQSLLADFPETLGPACPDLVLLDALYFNRSTLRLFTHPSADFEPLEEAPGLIQRVGAPGR